MKRIGQEIGTVIAFESSYTGPCNQTTKTT
jgi:hypothetical protein